MVIQRRVELYEQVAAGLAAEYSQLRSANVDTGMAGASAESVLVGWLKKWIPGRISVENGAVISVRDEPTNQMDCLLFDHIESPIFQRIGNLAILPVEGVVGAIEMNYGENTTYAKLSRDAQKLEQLGRMAVGRLRRAAVALTHLPIDKDSSSASAEELIAGLEKHMGHDQGPQLLIFVEELRGDLQEAAVRLMNHNKRVGVPFSVDGLFVLRQGFVLHVDSNKKGWNAKRLAGAELGFSSISEGQVLLKLQNVLLKHFYLAGKTHPPGFDAYTAQTDQGEREVRAAKVVSDEEYAAQGDDAVLLRG